MLEIKLLEWDSFFFGMKIGSLVINHKISSDFESILKKSKLDNFALIYIFDYYENEIQKELLFNYNISLVDTKVIFSKSIVDNIYEIKCRKFQIEDDVNELYSLAYQSGNYSRFNTDENFSKEGFLRLYKTWVDNSLQTDFGDDVFVFEENNKICGFLTIKYHLEKAIIGLLAVSKEFRGRKIGFDLMMKAEAESLKRKCTELEVATQIANADACKFYEKLNFTIKETSNIYHVWLQTN